MRSTMSRPDPIEYADRLYEAICDANFSPIAFLAFGNAVKEGVPLRNMPRVAAEPFMRIVGEMLDLEAEAAGDDLIDLDVSGPVPVIDAVTTLEAAAPSPAPPAAAEPPSTAAAPAVAAPEPPPPRERKRNGRR
jgi:hypothetical protein